jgi:hypothetical protein
VTFRAPEQASTVMAVEFKPDEQWDRVASELRAHREAQRQAWGDLDNATLGRYLAGEAEAEERRRVEAALEERPELRRLTDLVRDVLADVGPVEEPAPAVTAPPPAVLPFPTRTAPRRTKATRWRRLGALAAAASLLLALGLGAPRVLAPAGRETASTSNFPPVAGGVAFRPEPRDRPMFGPLFERSNTADAAPPAPSRDRPMGVIVQPVALAAADGLNRVGTYCEKTGDLGDAELSYQLVHGIRLRVLGPDAPATVEARRNLGQVYLVALNTPAPADAPSPPQAFAEKRNDARSGSLAFRERVVRRPGWRVRQTVTPALVQKLRDAATPEDRVQTCRALADLGPAAGEAVPALKDCLRQAQTPEERQAVVGALGAIGEMDAEAVVVLVNALQDPSPACRRAAADALVRLGPLVREEVSKAADKAETEKELAQDVLRRIRSDEGRFGVRDPSGLLSPLAVKAAQRELVALRRKYRIEVLAETAAEAPVGARPLDDRTGSDGLYLRVTRTPPAVEVHVGEALRRRGFDAVQEARLKQAVEARVADDDVEGGVLEGLRVVGEFEAKAAPTSAKP